MRAIVEQRSLHAEPTAAPHDFAEGIESALRAFAEACAAPGAGGEKDDGKDGVSALSRSEILLIAGVSIDESQRKSSVTVGVNALSIWMKPTGRWR